MSLGSNELVLYSDNTGELYKQKQAIYLNLLRHQLRGEYEPELGVKRWLYFANAGAKRYVKEMQLTEPWHKAFTPQDREDAARHWERWFREGARHGEFDYLLPEHKRPKRQAGNPGHGNPGHGEEKGRKRAGKRGNGKPKARRTRQRVCPVGMVVQSLVFDRAHYTVEQAKSWARRHDYSTSDLDDSGPSIRIRQKDPSKFAPGMFRTISLGQVHAVVGCPETGAGRKAPKKASEKRATKKAGKKRAKKASKKRATKKASKKRTTKLSNPGWKKVKGLDPGRPSLRSLDGRFQIDSRGGSFYLYDIRSGAIPVHWTKLGVYGSDRSAKAAAHDFERERPAHEAPPKKAAPKRRSSELGLGYRKSRQFIRDTARREGIVLTRSGEPLFQRDVAHWKEIRTRPLPLTGEEIAEQQMASWHDRERP